MFLCNKTCQRKSVNSSVNLPTHVCELVCGLANANQISTRFKEAVSKCKKTNFILFQSKRELTKEKYDANIDKFSISQNVYVSSSMKINMEHRLTFEHRMTIWLL